MKTLTSPITEARRRPLQRHCGGFTLLELVVALAIAGLFMGIAVPSAWKFYDSAQYRKAVRDLTQAAASARYAAITSGLPQDVVLHTDERRYLLRQRGETIQDADFRDLPGNISLGAVTAAEMSPRPGLAGIRFYPDGSSTGGRITIRRGTEASAGGVVLRVDWLLGIVSQESL